jgi:hypothetical protein
MRVRRGILVTEAQATAFAARLNAEAKASTSARRSRHQGGSQYERELARLIAIEGLITPLEQYRFALEEPPAPSSKSGRAPQYRFDFAWPDRWLAVEVDGGHFMVRRDKQGRPWPVGHHGTSDQLRKDNLAALLGWRVLRFDHSMIRSGEAIQTIKRALNLPPLP